MFWLVLRFSTFFKNSSLYIFSAINVLQSSKMYSHNTGMLLWPSCSGRHLTSHAIQFCTQFSKHKYKHSCRKFNLHFFATPLWSDQTTEIKRTTSLQLFQINYRTFPATHQTFQPRVIITVLVHNRHNFSKMFLDVIYYYYAILISTRTGNIFVSLQQRSPWNTGWQPLTSNVGSRLC